MNKIIWLAEWFPVEFEPFNGDAIERHAQAASLHNHIYIIYIKKDSRLSFGTVRKEERKYNDQCSATIYYYSSVKWFDRLYSAFYFFYLHFKAINNYRKKVGRPDAFQVNVSMRTGLIALWYRVFMSIPFLVVEHWGLFLPEAKPNWKEKGFLFRYFLRKVFKKASCVVTVSKHLGMMIKRDFTLKKLVTIPNAVDTSCFMLKEVRPYSNTIRFIHISNLAYPKNIDAMLSGFKGFLNSGYSAELVIHAPENKKLKEQISLLGLQSNIILKEEVPQPVLAESIRQSDALVLFSRYETFGVVVIEANACGVPVITSNYPTFNELIENYKNGIIAGGTDADSLTAGMIEFVKNINGFNAGVIATDATEKYSYIQIGKQFDELYKTVLQ